MLNEFTLHTSKSQNIIQTETFLFQGYLTASGTFKLGQFQIFRLWIHRWILGNDTGHAPPNFHFANFSSWQKAKSYNDTNKQVKGCFPSLSSIIAAFINPHESDKARQNGTKSASPNQIPGATPA